MHKISAFAERTATEQQNKFLNKQEFEKGPVGIRRLSLNIIAVINLIEILRLTEMKRLKKINREQRAVRRAPIVIAEEPIINIKTVLASGMKPRDH